jgi:hypothetical protein
MRRALGGSRGPGARLGSVHACVYSYWRWLCFELAIVLKSP